MAITIKESQDELNKLWNANPVVPNRPTYPDVSNAGPKPDIGGSQIVQRAYQNANPVIPNQPAPPTNELPSQTPVAQAQRGYRDAGIPGAVGGFARGVYDAVTGGLAGVGEHVLGPVFDAAGTAINQFTGGGVRNATSGKPRPAEGPAREAPGETPGSIGYTPSKPGPVQSFAFDPNSPSNRGGFVSGGDNSVIDAANAAARQKLDFMRAQENFALDQRNAAIDAGNRERVAAFEARNRQRAQDVDAFRDRNFMEWTLNANPKALAALKGQMFQGDRTTQNFNPVQSAAREASGKNPYLDALNAQAEAGSKALRDKLLASESGQKLEKGQLDIDTQKRLTGLHQAYATATTPEQKQSIADQVLLMHGHKPSEAWVIQPMGGGQNTDELGRVTKEGQYAILVNKNTGQKIEIGGPQQQQAPPKYAPGSVVRDKTTGKEYSVDANGQLVPRNA